MSEPYVAGFGKQLILKNMPESILANINEPLLVKGEDGAYVASMDGYSQEDRIELIRKLRDLGVAFSYGRDWAPSEIFEYYREKGFLTGSYKRISWANPEKFIVEDR